MVDMEGKANTEQSKRSLLLVNQSAPYSSAQARESLDVALSAAAFEIPVSVLFIEDCCYQLLQNQQAEKINGKQLTRMFGAFPIYGIDNLYVCEHSVKKRGIGSQMETLPIKLVSRDTIRDMHRHAQTVLRF